MKRAPDNTPEARAVKRCVPSGARSLLTRVGLGLIVPVAAAVVSAAPLHAQALPADESSPLPVPGAGLVYLHVDSDDDATPAFELTFTDPSPRLWRAGFMAGLISSVRGEVYGYGGLQLPIPLPLGLVARPSVAAGLYSTGEGFDLGHALEFRSALLLERGITDRVRVSTVFFHLSNAGLGRSNPGMEALGFGVSFVPSPLR